MRIIQTSVFKKTVSAVAIAGAVNSAVLIPVAEASPATRGSVHAYAASGIVVMTGQAQCGGMWWNPKANWLYINASNGESGKAWVDRNTGNWSFTLRNVPSYGTVVSAKWGCPNGATKSTQKSVARPTWGYSAYMSHWF